MLFQNINDNDSFKNSELLTRKDTVQVLTEGVIINISMLIYCFIYMWEYKAQAHLVHFIINKNSKQFYVTLFKALIITYAKKCKYIFYTKSYIESAKKFWP